MVPEDSRVGILVNKAECMAFCDLSQSHIASLLSYITVHSSPLRFKEKGQSHHLSMRRMSKNLQLSFKISTGSNNTQKGNSLKELS